MNRFQDIQPKATDSSSSLWLLMAFAACVTIAGNNRAWAQDSAAPNTDSASNTQSAETNETAQPWPTSIQTRIQQHAGDQASTWLDYYTQVPQPLRKSYEFQLQHMPVADLQTLTPQFLLQNTQQAHQAWEAAPWKDQISEALFLNDVLPYANIDETREDWRSDFMKRFTPLVASCKTPGEAAQVLNREVFNQVGVHYSTQRRKANQSPSESIQQGKASCTGLSILLVDACRSVGVPARLAGIPSWVNKRGNHTWVEVWDQGQWHFTGADEPSDQGLDHAWFEGDARLAKKDQRMNSIYAVSFQQTETRFPMVWSPDGSRTVYAQNVTERYTQQPEVAETEGPKLRIRLWDQGRKQRLVATVAVDCQQCIGDEPMTGTTRGDRADMNDLLEFPVVVGRTYELTASRGDQQIRRTIKITESSDQLLEWEWVAEQP